MPLNRSQYVWGLARDLERFHGANASAVVQDRIDQLEQMEDVQELELWRDIAAVIEKDRQRQQSGEP